MSVKLTQLQCKEVICVNDGMRLGYISDVLVEVPGGEICAVVVPGPCRILGLFGREDDYIIGWERIRRIGDDIILVEVSGEYRREKKAKKFWL